MHGGFQTLCATLFVSLNNQPIFPFVLFQKKILGRLRNDAEKYATEKLAVQCKANFLIANLHSSQGTF